MPVSRRGPDNTCRVAVSGDISGAANWANIFWFLLTTTAVPTQANLDTWLAAIRVAYGNNIMPLAGSSVTARLFHATFFSPGGGTVLSDNTNTLTGTGGTDSSTPASASVVLSWRIPSYYRGGKPRTYVPGLAASQLTDPNTIASTFVTTAKTNAEGFRTACNAASAGNITGTSMGTVHFRRGNVELSPPTFEAYSGSTVHSRIGSQRSRLGKWVA